MQCWQCGKELDEKNDFCVACGASRRRPPEDDADGADEKLHALLAEANLLRLRKSWSGAIARCTEALRLSPESAVAHSLLGDICRDEGRLQDAVEWYKLALGLDSSRKRDRDQLDMLINQLYGAGGLPSRAEPETAAAEKPPKTKKLKYSNVMVLAGFLLLATLLLLGIIYFLGHRQREAGAVFHPSDIGLTPFPSSPVAPPSGKVAEPPSGQEAPPAAAAGPAPEAAGGEDGGGKAPAKSDFSSDLYLREKKLRDTLKELLSRGGDGYNLLGAAIDPRSGRLEISFSLPTMDNAETARGTMLVTAYYLARAAALTENGVTSLTLRGAMKFPAGPGMDDVPAFIGDADAGKLRKTAEGEVSPQQAEAFITNIWWLAMLEPSPSQ